MPWIKVVQMLKHKVRKLRGGSEYKAYLFCTSKIEAADHVRLRADSSDQRKMPLEPTD